MKNIKSIFKLTTLFCSAIVLGLSLSYSLVSADSSNASSPSSTSSTCSGNPSSSAYQQRLNNIISLGTQEINRRLTNLGNLTNIINSATKLSPSDQATLSQEVSTTVSGLNTLKSQLADDTTICAAHSDVLSIYSEYRVYALVNPKVRLIKAADDQQVTENNLLTLSTKLQSRISKDQQANKNVASLQTDLNNMTQETNGALSTSSSVESNVINLEPSDYNSNHSVLEGYRSQLQTAQKDIQSAVANAKAIISGLQSI